MTENWRTWHSVEFYALYTLTTIVKVIKLGIMRWEVHVARVRKKFVLDVGEGYLKKDHLDDPGVGGRIILKRMLNRMTGRELN